MGVESCRRICRGAERESVSLFCLGERRFNEYSEMTMGKQQKLLTALALGIGAASAWRGYIRNKRLYDVEGKVVLIVGGSRGLGLILARQLAEQGARLAICARDEGGRGWAGET